MKRITTLGPHNMDSVSKGDYEATKAYGTHVIPLRKFRAIGATAALAHPDGERVYVSIDIDSFDPSDLDRASVQNGKGPVGSARVCFPWTAECRPKKARG